jgi:hypothetical protein
MLFLKGLALIWGFALIWFLLYAGFASWIKFFATIPTLFMKDN